MDLRLENGLVISPDSDALWQPRSYDLTPSDLFFADYKTATSQELKYEVIRNISGIVLHLCLSEYQKIGTSEGSILHYTSIITANQKW